MISIDNPQHANPAVCDRASAGSDQSDRAAAGTERLTGFGEAPERQNRRGRRHLAGEMRRTERRIFRSLVRTESEELQG